MSSNNSKAILIIFTAALLLCGVSSCRTHNGGRACPSYSNITKTEKPA